MKIISGSSNTQLASQIAHQLNIPLMDTEITQFANGEKRVWIKEAVRGENVILVQSFSQPTDENIMEFLLLTDALERLGVRHISLFLPWMGYSLQDKVFREGEPIAAKVVADLISNVYIKRVFLLDLHNTSIPGFFSIPTEYLSAMSLFVDYVKTNIDLSQAVVASPDFGGLKRARLFAKTLGLDLVNIDKDRNLQTGEVTAFGVHGNVKNKIVLLFDDCILSGGTVVEAAEILKKEGAKQVYFLATHGLFTGEAKEKLQKSMVDKVVITNSIAQDNLPKKIDVLDLSSIFVNAINDWM